jgi:hypothetical protein
MSTPVPPPATQPPPYPQPAYYGRPAKPPTRRRWLWPTASAVAFLVGAGVGAAGASQPAATVSQAAPSAETVVVTVTAPAPPAARPRVVTKTVTRTVTVTPKATETIPGDGTFVVGREVRPGTYRTAGGSNCYWARLRGLGGELSDVITNGNVTGPTTVLIRPSDKGFETTGCEGWQRVS